MKRRASGWSFRLSQQAKTSLKSMFVTLTYNTENVPISKKGYMDLDKTDVQKFMKRLRKLSYEKIKYYACGEYGGKTNRPHYHIILFNATSEQVEKAWALDNKPLGAIHIGDVTPASIGYTLKYISKPKRIPLHNNDDRQPEFALMSKGLGANYLTKAMVQWHKNNITKRMYVPLEDGKKAAMPRYYKDKIYSEGEKIKLNHHMKMEAEKQLEKDMTELGEKYYHIMYQRTKHAFTTYFKNAQTTRNKI